MEVLPLQVPLLLVAATLFCKVTPIWRMVRRCWSCSGATTVFSRSRSEPRSTAEEGYSALDPPSTPYEPLGASFDVGPFFGDSTSDTPRRLVLTKYAPHQNSLLRYEMNTGDTLDPSKSEVAREVPHNLSRGILIRWKSSRSMPTVILRRKLKIRWQAIKDDEARSGLTWIDESTPPVFPTPAPAHSVFKNNAAVPRKAVSDENTPCERRSRRPLPTKPGLMKSPSKSSRTSPTRSIHFTVIRKPSRWSENNGGILPTPVTSKPRASVLYRVVGVLKPATNLALE